MKMRNGSSENKLFFRSERFIRVNQSYYFQCREGEDQGPFTDISTARLMLSRFLLAQHVKNSIDIKKPGVKLTQEANLQSVGDPQSLAPRKRAKRKAPPLERPLNKKAEGTRPTAKQKTTKPVTQKKAPICKKSTVKVTFKKHPVEEYQLGAAIAEFQIPPESTSVEFIVNDSRFEFLGTTLKLRDNEYFDAMADSPVAVDVEIQSNKGASIKKNIQINVQSIKNSA